LELEQTPLTVQEDEFIRTEIAEELDRLNEGWSKDGSRNIYKWFVILNPENRIHIPQFLDMYSRFMLKAIIGAEMRMNMLKISIIMEAYG
jgi:hypothetical protein